MHAVRGEAQKDVAFATPCGRSLATLHRADGKARQVEVALVVHARHFRRLAADQGAAAVGAALGDAIDDPGGLFDLKLAGGEIVQEEQGLGPWQTRSLTHIATRSMPMVSTWPVSMAMRSLVPTPSVAATRTGSL
jgi:hypothetical protein